jgi:hypothetical protein
MSDCEIVMVRGVEDANGYPCGGTSVAECSDCGAKLCDLHFEECDLCDETVVAGEQLSELTPFRPDCCNQAIAQVCAVCSPPKRSSVVRRGGFERNRDVSPTTGLCFVYSVMIRSAHSTRATKIAGLPNFAPQSFKSASVTPRARPQSKLALLVGRVVFCRAAVSLRLWMLTLSGSAPELRWCGNAHPA